MTDFISRDGRGPKISRKLVCVSDEGYVPVIEIPTDSGREKQETSLKMLRTKLGDLLELMELEKLKKMARAGDTHLALNKVMGIDVESSEPSKYIASGIVEHTEGLNLGGMFTNIRTCPPKFSLNTVRE